jgi:hypothetical protein
MIAIPIALTVIAFFVVRSMARTALRLDDAEAASAAVRAVQPPMQPPPMAPPTPPPAY